MMIHPSTYRTFAEIFELHSVHRYRSNGTKTCCICLQAEEHTIHAYEDHIRSASVQHKFWPIQTSRWASEICGHCSGRDTAPVHQQGGTNAVTAHPYKPETPTATATAPTTWQQSIDEEARTIVFGDREQVYDDPNVNFEKIALMWTGTLLRKLKPDVSITPQDVALMFIQLKISRESFRPKRDNRVDIIGYALCLQRIIDELEDIGGGGANNAE